MQQNGKNTASAEAFLGSELQVVFGLANTGGKTPKEQNGIVFPRLPLE